MSSRSYRRACIAYGCLFNTAVLLMQKNYSRDEGNSPSEELSEVYRLSHDVNMPPDQFFSLFVCFVLPYYRSAKSSRFCLDILQSASFISEWRREWVLGNCTGVKILCCVHLYDRLL